MSWLLRIVKLLPLNKLLPLVGRMALGDWLWELTRTTVESIERTNPKLSGPEKSAIVFQCITLDAAAAEVAWKPSLVNLGIEIAVQIMKEMFRQNAQAAPPTPPMPSPGVS